MKKIFLKFFSILLVFVSCFLFLVSLSSADQLDDLTKQINDLTSALNQSVNATRPLESQLNAMQTQITGIKNRVVAIEQDVVQKQKEIDASFKDLDAKKALLSHVIRSFYIQQSHNSPILIFLSGNSAENIIQTLQSQKATTDMEKQQITNLALAISDLEQKQKDLENEKTRLTAIKADLDIQSSKLDKIVSGAKAYQATLSGQIAQLSAQQQQLLAAKYASLGIPLSAYTTKGGCSSDIAPFKDPGFGGTKFAFFSYGVPNRVGLNQYGAKGRAEAGKPYTDILSAYYNAQLTTGNSQSINIHVAGTNDYGQAIDQNLSIEDYVKHIYEMPTNWPAEALKAQAIAARSYALAYTNNGASSICTDQHCQEFKQELNTQAWIDAVNATAGQVLTSGGQPIKAWFSSTHGGYEFTSSDIGWSGTSHTKRLQDTTSNVGSFAELNNNAYDKASPWFYCDWGARSQYNGTAWLKSDEVADIANVVSLVTADSGTISHLSQTDKPNPDGTDTWDVGRVKSELQNRGITPFNNVSSVNINADFTNGKVVTITVNGDSGSKNYDGQIFKQYFNLRAPANINIVGPLYNIEVR